MIICFTLGQSRADTIALSATENGAFSATEDLTLGWAFTLSSAALLTQLGIWDGPTSLTSTAGDGLAQSHTVTIWTSAGVQQTQATVPSGGGPETDNFRYVTLPNPVFLSLGSYTIGAFFAANSPDTFILGANTVTTASGVSYNGSRSTPGNAFPPGDFMGFSNSYFGPNFQFNNVITEPVPELGSSCLLLLLGLTATATLKRFVPRQA